MQITSLKLGNYLGITALCLSIMLLFGALPAQAAQFSGPLAKMVAHGKHLFIHDTFGGRGMTCDACHTDGGMGPTVVSGRKGPSLANAAAVFPRYKADDGKVMTLAAQIHGCIGGALGGKSPAYGSRDMTALITYITSLSQGKRINMGGTYK